MALKAPRVRDLFTYDPESGLLYRIRWRGRSVANAPAITSETTTIDGREYRVDRVIWCYVNGKWPVGNVLHTNGNPEDNRIDNLVESGYSPVEGKMLGAHFNHRTKRWYAQISRGGKNQNLGTFNTALEAHAAYIEARDGIGRVAA